MKKQHYLQHYQKHQVDIIHIKIKKLLKFRRDLVLKNLLENKYINETIFADLKDKKIILKKRKKIFLEDSRYYVEEVRKDIIDQLGYDKVYKEGLNIKTPLNLNLQEIASSVLRNGIENYDKKKRMERGKKY